MHRSKTVFVRSAPGAAHVPSSRPSGVKSRGGHEHAYDGVFGYVAFITPTFDLTSGSGQAKSTTQPPILSDFLSFNVKNS